MNRGLVGVAVALAALVVAAPAAAQEAGRVGLTMGYPASAGVIWHATDRVAVRPEVSFSFSTTSSEVPSPGPDMGTGESASIATGVSLLLYLQDAAAFRTYVSPRYAHARSTNTFTSSLTGADLETTSRAHSWTGVFGAQYQPAERFALFGEAGVGWTRSRTQSPASGLRTTARTWAARSGVGVIVYF